jgi:hypothetical protein
MIDESFTVSKKNYDMRMMMGSREVMGRLMRQKMSHVVKSRVRVSVTA